MKYCINSPKQVNRKVLLILAGFILLINKITDAQVKSGAGVQKILFRKGEKWFGGAVNEGHQMPFRNGYSLDLYGDNKGNQTAPLLLSSKGRFIWSGEPFQFTFENDQLIISKAKGKVIIDSNGHSLAQAFKAASKQFFPANGKYPDTLLFSRPQYNTWIELVYNQNQEDVLKYAHSIIDNGFPPGVLMIDDNWADYYGKFSFRKDRFSNARSMVEELHRMGFKVMLWVSPFISPDTEVFRDLLRKKLLLFDNGNNKNADWKKAEKPAIINWWNGYSAVMDFTNPGAIAWYAAQLDSMVSGYGINGFKFDGGDMEYYPPTMLSYKKVTPNEQCESWGIFGTMYPLNEYRAMWKRGGQPLVQRLRDKEHKWEDVQKLIPHIIIAGLLGYQFTCPDMIGGGEFGSFIGRDKLDQELVVRSAQISAVMPMMQFSVAPWRVLDKEYLIAVKKAVDTRMKFTPYIIQLAKESAISGEPIVRSLEYVFPNKGFEMVKDQFMLGEKYMVAPMVEKGNKRKVSFPDGRWIADDGKRIDGPVVLEMEVPIERLPVFEFEGK
ncbi:MAG: glycoside hydrolase family 31 protein [Ferruginibacter sp.]